VSFPFPSAATIRGDDHGLAGTAAPKAEDGDVAVIVRVAVIVPS
jgi:hypothetical protein